MAREHRDSFRRRTSKRRSSDRRAKTRRATKMVEEGAYRKAIGALTTNMANLTNQDQQRFAGLLLPGSQRAGESLHPAPMATDMDAASPAPSPADSGES